MLLERLDLIEFSGKSNNNHFIQGF